MHSGHSFFNGLTLSAPICRGRHFLLGTLNPYYSRAGEDQFCSTSHVSNLLTIFLREIFLNSYILFETFCCVNPSQSVATDRRCESLMISSTTNGNNMKDQ